MTTYMTWETSGGKKGRCDPKCHNAKKPKCRCMCGGIMHGQAVGKTEQGWQQYKQEKNTSVLINLTTAKETGHIKNWILKAEQHQLPLEEVKEK